jgi:hypothetical protein
MPSHSYRAKFIPTEWAGTVTFRNLNSAQINFNPKTRKGYFVGGKLDGETFDFYDAEEEYEFNGETYIYAGTEGDMHIYELWEE